jgi:hypothetical protein
MRRITELGLLVLRHWPQLAACYLVGLLGRRGAIELAAWVGHDRNLWPALIMPLAGIAQLGSYVAMFFVVRPAIPALAGIPRRPLREVDVFATIVAPFMAIYLAWQMFREDWLAFEARALDYRIGEIMSSPPTEQLRPDSLPVSATTWVVIVIALMARSVLSRTKDRLPRWFLAVRIYLDALWVFLVLSFSVNRGLTLLIDPAGWLAQRRIVVWFTTGREQLFSHVAPVEALWDTVIWALRTVFGGAAVPLVWLAVAGIVYGVSATTAWTAGWGDTARRLAGDRAVHLERHAPVQRRLNTRWRRMPARLRREAADWARGQLGKFTPIADTARILVHGGVVALSVYVLAYLVLAWLDMSGSFYRAQLGPGYLVRGVAWVLGPHPQLYWNAVTPTLELGSQLLLEPVRVCLIALTLAHCVEHALRVRAAPGSPRPVP